MEKPVNTDNGQQTVSDFEIGWLAGLIEGEGSIVLQVNARNGRIQGLRVNPRVILTNTDQLLIEKACSILDRLGIGKWVNHTKPNNRAHANLVKVSYKDITYIHITGFKRLQDLLNIVGPHFYGEKAERVRLLQKFIARRFRKAETRNISANSCYDAEDIENMLEFLRLTKSPNYGKITGMLNEHTREAKHEHRKAMKRRYYKSAAERGYVRPSRRALDSRENVRAVRNDQPLPA
jgi:hypothetical protein